MLFGVNLFNNESLYDYLTDFLANLRKLTWINDFSCIAEFDSEEHCLNAYYNLQVNNDENLEKSNVNDFDWKIAKGHKLNDVDINDIEIRISEINDVLKKCPKDEAVYYKYYDREEIKKRYENNSNKNHINQNNNFNQYLKNSNQNSRRFENRYIENGRFNHRNFNNFNYSDFEFVRNNRYSSRNHYNNRDRDIDKDEIFSNRNNGPQRFSKYERFDTNYNKNSRNNRDEYRKFKGKLHLGPNKEILNKNDENGEISKRSTPRRERSRSISQQKFNNNHNENNNEGLNN